MTLNDLCAVVREECPGHPFGIDENPIMPMPINRKFWARVWAAIWNKPVIEQRQILGYVRVIILGHPEIHQLRERIESVRQAGIVVVVERVGDANRLGVGM